MLLFPRVQLLQVDFWGNVFEKALCRDVHTHAGVAVVTVFVEGHAPRFFQVGVFNQHVADIPVIVILIFAFVC